MAEPTGKTVALYNPSVFSPFMTVLKWYKTPQTCLNF